MGSRRTEAHAWPQVLLGLGQQVTDLPAVPGMRHSAPDPALHGLRVHLHLACQSFEFYALSRHGSPQPFVALTCHYCRTFRRGRLGRGLKRPKRTTRTVGPSRQADKPWSGAELATW